MKIYRNFSKPFILLITFLIILAFSVLEAQDNKDFEEHLFENVNKLIQEAENENAETLSPESFSKGLEYYHEAQKIYKKSGKLKKIERKLTNAEYYLSISIETAKISRAALKDVMQMRATIIAKKLNEHAPKEFSKAEKELINTAKKIERGDIGAGRNRSVKIKELYRKTAISAYENVFLKQARDRLEKRSEGMYITEYKQSKEELNNTKKWIKEQSRTEFVLNDFIIAADEKLGLVTEILYPAWFINMPDTLILGDFTLIINKYDEKGLYDFSSNTTNGASGTAQVHFSCGFSLLTPMLPGGLQLITKPFTVVETVLEPSYEMSLLEAIKFDPEAVVGAEIALPLAEETVDKYGIMQAKDQLLSNLQLLPPKSGITMKFENAIIAPGEKLTQGYMLAGSASYPTIPIYPEVPAKIFVAGFRVTMDSLYITNSGATAIAKLHLPKSIIDGNGCGPAIIDLGSINISQDCQFYRNMPDSLFGPFTTDKTGLIFEGEGIIADFDKNSSPSGYSLAASWRGVILQNGTTIEVPTTEVISNSGYLKAKYRFTNGLVTGSGLKARFDLDAAYQFKTLVPYDYVIDMSSGYLEIDSSAVASGKINSGQITSPKIAVCNYNPGQKISAYFSNMNIQRDLDLAGSVIVNQEVFWGELTNNGDEIVTFYAKPNSSLPDHAWFYLAGKATSRFIPNSDLDFENISFWGDLASKLENNNIAGMTIFNLAELIIYTPDVLGTPKKLTFTDGLDCSLSQTWFNIETLGINGEITISLSSRNEALGDTIITYYKASEPFNTELSCISQKERCFYLRFSSSALYDSEFHGKMILKGACNTEIPFVDLELTSTANLVGGDIDLSAGPVTLDHWQVELVETSPGDPAGALSVRTGQIILTQAGIKEDRHFAKPFTSGNIISNENTSG